MPFSVILTEKGGATQRLDFESEEITIGRVDENDICLPKGNISKKHTKIVVKDGKIIVLDLKSTNGTYVNGKKLAGPLVITPTDKVYARDFNLNIEPPEMQSEEALPEDGDEVDGQPTMTPARSDPDDATDQPQYQGGDATRREGYPDEEEAPPEEEALPEAEPEAELEPVPDEEESIPTPMPVRKVAPPPPKPKPIPAKPAPAPSKSALAGAKAAAAAAAKTPSKASPPSKGARKKRTADVSEEYAQTLNLVHDRLIEAMDLRRLDLDALGSEELWKKTEATIRAFVAKMDSTDQLDPHSDRERLGQDVLHQT